METTVEMTSNDSQKYKNVILEASLISQGDPSVHLLPSQTQKPGRFLKKTIGTKKPNRQNKTILLLGETGCGKSTIINPLFNFAIGVKWEEKVWFEIAENQSEAKTDFLQSQTSEVTVYEIHSENLPFSLSIIDTPGLGDTRGTDGLLTHRLLDLFQSEFGVSEIHAVGLVMKATENRLTPKMSYVFNSVTSLFGKDMEQLIIPLFTHSDGQKPTNALQALKAANVKCATDENNEPLYFLFDNCQDGRTEEATLLEVANDNTTKNMEVFMKFLEEQQPQHVGETVKVLKERISLRQGIEKLTDQVKQIKDKEEEIHRSWQTLTESEKLSKLFQNFTHEETQTYVEEEPVDKIGWIFYSGATCCKICKVNCHFPGCIWAPNPAWCEVMKDGRCTVCPNKCPAEDHVKKDKKYTLRIKTTIHTDEEMKETYEENEAKREVMQREFNILQKDQSDLREAKYQSLDEVFRSIEKLEQIALNMDSVSTYVHLEFLIENMKERGDTEKVQKLQRIRDWVDEPIKAGAKYLETVED